MQNSHCQVPPGEGSLCERGPKACGGERAREETGGAGRLETRILGMLF